MNKLKMAHEYAIALINSGSESMEFDKFIKLCHNYADAMHAEHEKRQDKSRPEVLNDGFVIDWGLAPDWANWWTMDSNGQCLWHKNKPDLSYVEWVIDFTNAGGDCYKYAGKASDFNYQGDWKQSLRKRP